MTSPDNQPDPTAPVAANTGGDFPWPEDGIRFGGDDSSSSGDEGLIPLAEDDPAPEIELMGAPAPPRPADSRAEALLIDTASPRYQPPSRWPGRLLVVAILAGLGYGAYMGLDKIRSTWGEFVGNVDAIHKSGVESPTGEKEPRPKTEAGVDDHTPDAGDDLLRDWNNRILGSSAKKKPAPAPKPQTTTLSRQGYTLSAIVAGSGGHMAMINGQCVRVGDQVDGATVSAIDASSATLSRDGLCIVLKW